jgi:hypothetical protein
MRLHAARLHATWDCSCARAPRGVFATATLCAACALLGIACGGTTGREGLAIPGNDGGGRDGTTPDATLATDATFDVGAFDVNIVYVDRVLPDIQAHDGGSDAPAADAAASDAPKGLAPCTSADAGLTDAGVTDCVSCQGNLSGICTPTEALFVGLDISLGRVSAPGPDTTTVLDAGPDADGGPPPPQTCYECLVAGGCLDSLGLTGNECEDGDPTNTMIVDDASVFLEPSPSGGTGMYTTPEQCRAVVACVLGSGVGAAQCAAQSPATCYCGEGVSLRTCASGSPSDLLACSVPDGGGAITGVCAQQIAAGLGCYCGDGADIAVNTNTTDLAAGCALQIFTCGGSNGCTQCL